MYPVTKQQSSNVGIDDSPGWSCAPKAYRWGVPKLFN